MKQLILTFFLMIMVMLPNVSLAQQIVPEACDDPATCGTCEFVDLINNLIQFILWFATIAATIMILYGGFRLVTSQGSVEALKKAKSIITNVVIGYVLALAAFLIINTLLSIILPNTSPVLGWQKIECLYATEVKDETYTEPTFGKVDLSNFFTSGGGWLSLGGGGGSSDTSFLRNQGLCSTAFLSPYFGSQANEAACIVAKESACGASPLSRTDTDRNGYPFSVGIFQINMTVHNVIGCAGKGAVVNNLNCPAAYSGKNYSARIVNKNLYEQCRNALLNPQCSAINAVRIKNARGGSWRDWSTAQSCRLR
tara:strand:+ start:2067 stop:2999 length:933 start_codon:yes stop_codon:yes gene_type:complete